MDLALGVYCKQQGEKQKGGDKQHGKAPAFQIAACQKDRHGATGQVTAFVQIWSDEHDLCTSFTHKQDYLKCVPYHHQVVFSKWK